jgi:hypothetical protein
MAHLGYVDIFGYWLGIFLTFCILSFLYKDNPFYKIAEHLFIGVSIGYVVTKQYFDVVKPKAVENLFDKGQWWYVFALVVAVMLLLKLFKRTAWMGRWPIAFVVGFYAGIQINGVAQGDLVGQGRRAMESIMAEKLDVNVAEASELNLLPGFSPGVTERVIERRQEQPFIDLDELAELPGLTDMQRQDLLEARGALIGLDAQARVGGARAYDWFRTASQLLLLLGLLAGLVYFYFSTEQKGAVGKISRVGVWVLMIGFGASFGYTVQGRLALAVGRAMDVLGRDKDPNLAEQISGPTVALVSIVIVVAGIAVWELRRRGRSGRDSTSTEG